MSDQQPKSEVAVSQSFEINKEFVLPQFQPKLVVTTVGLSGQGRIVNVLEGPQAGEVLVSPDGINWVRGEEAKALNDQWAEEVKTREAQAKAPHVSVSAGELKNLFEGDLTFEQLLAFVDANRYTLDPHTPIMLPGYNDCGIMVASTQLGLIEIKDTEYTHDGEVVRKFEQVEGDNVRPNAILLAHS